MVSMKSIDDKVGDWGDFADLSESELAVLFAEMGLTDAPFDRNTIKAMMLAEMSGSGAPPDVLQQMSAQLDGMLGMLEGTIGASMASYPTDMAREFKQIYSANCCGKAQFIAALGAAETKLANAFGASFSKSMANLAGQSGVPGGAVAAFQGSFGGSTTIIYDAGDPEVIAAANMVANGRGGRTNVASNTNPGGNTPPAGSSNQAPPLNPGGNTNPGGSNNAPLLPTSSVPPANPTGNTPTVPTTPATPGTPITPTTPPGGTPTGTNTPPPPPPPGQQVVPNPGNQPPGAPPTQLSTLVTPPSDPKPVAPVAGGIDTPPPPELDPSGLLDLTPEPATLPGDGGGKLPDPTNTDSTGSTELDKVTSYRPPGYNEDPADDLRDKITGILGEIERNPDRKPELIGELRQLNTELQNMVNENNNTGLTGFWASDTSEVVLTAVPYVVDGAKITVIAVACVGTGGAACAGVAAVDTVFSVVDPAAGVVGNTVANYDASGDAGTSTLDALGSQLYEEGSKAIAGTTFTQAIGEATIEGMGAKGEVLVKVVELTGKAIGEFGPGLVSGGGGANSSFDASATLGSSGSGGSFYSGGSAGSGTLIQR